MMDEPLAGIWLKFLPRGQAAFKVPSPLRVLTVVSWKSYRGEVAGIRGELLAERSMTIMNHVGTYFRRRGPVNRRLALCVTISHLFVRD